MRIVFFLLLNWFFTISLIAQLSDGVEESIYYNIEGFKLNKFLKNASTLRTDIVVNEIKKFNYECRLLYDIVETNFKYPLNSWKVIGFIKEGVLCEDTLLATFPNLNNRFLIAINNERGKEVDVKYLSGKMYLDNISYDYDLDRDNPISFIPYLIIRKFDIGLEQIKFKRKINCTSKVFLKS